MIAYRIYEISDSGHRTVMGWGDHSHNRLGQAGDPALGRDGGVGDR